MDSYQSEDNVKLSTDETRHLRTFGRWFFRVGIAVIVAILTVLASISLRLAFGPIDLNFVRTYIQSAIDDADTGLNIKFNNVEMVWERWLRPYEIVIKDIRISDGKEDGDTLKISEVGVSLWVERLITGQFEIRNIFIYSPKLILKRNADSGFGIKLSGNSDGQELSYDELIPLFVLGQGREHLGSFANINKVVISNSQVTLQDEIAKELWTLPKTTFTLNRYDDGFRIRARMKPDKAGLLASHLEIELKHLLGSSRVDLAVDFNKVNFAELLEANRHLFEGDLNEETEIEKALEFLHDFNFPLKGRLNLAFVPKTGQLIEGKVMVQGGAGTFTLYEDKMPISEVAIHADIDHSLINVDRLQATLAGAKISLKGNHRSAPQHPLFIHKWLEGGSTVTAKVDVTSVNLDSLLKLWPKRLAIKAREWISDEIKSADIPELDFNFEGHVGDNGEFLSDRTEGAFLIDDLKINYLEGLPHAEKISAKANFDHTGFEIDIAKGQVLGVNLLKGIVNITGLDNDDEQLSLDLDLSGPLSDILKIIDYDPLNFTRQAKIDPVKTKGEGSMKLRMSFPLIDDLKFSQIKLNLDGAFRDIETSVDVESMPLTVVSGNIVVKVDEEHFEASGEAKVNELTSRIKSTVYFEHQKLIPWDTQIVLSTTASAKDFKRLGYDYTEYMTGSAKSTFTFQNYPKANPTLGIQLGLQNMEVEVPHIGWLKPVGQPASLGFKLVIGDKGISKANDINLESDYIEAKGTADFDSNGDVHAIYLNSVEAKDTSAAISVIFIKEGGYELHFSGNRINAEAFMDYLDDDTERPKNKGSYPVRITSNVDVLQMKSGAEFRDVNSVVELMVKPDDVYWTKVQLNAAAGVGTNSNGRMGQEAGGISLDLMPNASGGQKLQIHANDAGQLLKNLEVYDDLLGGSMIVNATRIDQGPFVGTLQLDNFDATQIPLVGRLSSILSPMGIVNLFSSQGRVTINSFNCNFSYSDSEVIFSQGVGKSIGLGFTTEGRLDLVNNTFDIKGNLIPAYVLNSILDNIPILGSLLSGGKGEGIFAMAYTVKGDMSDPRIDINPLTALAPGFLRSLFENL